MLPDDDKRYAIETCRSSESVLKKWFKNKWHTISAFVGFVIIIDTIHNVFIFLYPYVSFWINPFPWARSSGWAQCETEYSCSALPVDISLAVTESSKSTRASNFVWKSLNATEVEYCPHLSPVCHKRWNKTFDNIFSRCGSSSKAVVNKTIFHVRV